MARDVRCKYLDDLTGLYLVVIRNHFLIYLCTAHFMTDLGVYRICKVDNSCAYGKGYHIAFWRKGKHVLRGKVILYRTNDLLNIVRLLLGLYYLSYPRFYDLHNHNC